LTSTTSTSTSPEHSREHEPEGAPDLLRRLFTARNGALLFLAFCLVITFVSAGVSAVLATVPSTGPGNRTGALGQILESVSAAFSGLSFIALVVVAFRLQCAELRSRHQAMEKSQSALHRSAEADIRALHVQLIKMSLDDEDLAAVWPQYQGPVSAVRSKQNKYANLIIQHQRMLYELGVFDRDDLISMLRYLFTSPLIRGFWEGRMVARRVLTTVPGRETEFDEIVDIAYRESVPPEPPERPRARGGRDADVIDLDARRNPESDAA
jgi:hypothetical protein